MNNVRTRDLMKQLNQYFESSSGIPRIRHGKRQTVDALISEEVFLLAKYFRTERESINLNPVTTAIRRALLIPGLGVY